MNFGGLSDNWIIVLLIKYTLVSLFKIYIYTNFVDTFSGKNFYWCVILVVSFALSQGHKCQIHFICFSFSIKQSLIQCNYIVMFMRLILRFDQQPSMSHTCYLNFLKRSFVFVFSIKSITLVMGFMPSIVWVAWG